MGRSRRERERADAPPGQPVRLPGQLTRPLVARCARVS